MTLQQLVRAFLDRPVPPESEPVSDSLAEGILATYAAQGSAGMGPEEAELLELCIAESESIAAEGSAAERSYFQESTTLLQGILAEITGAQ